MPETIEVELELDGSHTISIDGGAKPPRPESKIVPTTESSILNLFAEILKPEVKK